MNKTLSEQIRTLLISYKKNEKRSLILILAAFLVIGVTALGMSMPAITATPELICGQEEHVHGDSCYTETRKLFCVLEENEEHTHTDDCYTTEQILTCDMAEHIHDSSCYEQDGTISAQTSDKMTADVSYKAGVLQQNTYLSAKKLEGNEAAPAEAMLLEELEEHEQKAEVILVYDLNLAKDSVDVEPEGTVDVKLTFKEPVSTEEQNLTWKLYHFTDQELLIDLSEDPNTVISTNENNEVTEVTFETDSFSNYILTGVIHEESEDEIEEEDDSTMKLVGDGEFVKSADLKDFLTGLEISGLTKDANGVYQVYAGDQYTIKMHFAETDEKIQFDLSKPLTYQLPAGIKIPSKQTKIGTLKVDNTLSLEYEYTVDTDGKITINWIDTSSEAWKKLQTSPYTTLHVEIEAIFNQEKIEFEGNADGSVDVDTSHDLKIEKTGTYNADTNSIDYEVKITSIGHNEKVHVKDIISGTALSYKKDAASTDGKGTVTQRDDGFDFDVDSMSNNESIVIKYSAELKNLGTLEMKNGVIGTEGETKNTAKVTGENVPEDPKHEVTISSKDFKNKIRYTDLTKSSVKNETKDGVRTIQWRIIANADANISVAGKKITDEIVEPSYMKYSETAPVTITVKDKDGNVIRTETKTLKDEPFVLDQEKKTWTYTIPASDKDQKYSYQIDYATEIDTADVTGYTEIKNKAEDEYDNRKNSSDGWIGPDNPSPSEEYSLKKKYQKIDYVNKEITWTVTVEVPKEGYNQKFEIKDVVPSSYLNGKMVYDELVEDSLTIEGLLEDTEAYTLDASKKSSFSLTFYQDKAKTKPGIAATDEDRTLKLTYKTKIPDEVISEAEKGTFNRNNTVTVSRDGKNQITFDQATLNLSLTPLSKEYIQEVTNTVDGAKLPAYKFQIEIGGLTDSAFDEDGNLEIVDEFDGDYLAYLAIDQYDHNQLRGQDVYNSKSQTTKITPKVNGNKLTFTLNKDNLIKDGSGYYAKYQLTYYLTVKDQKTLEALQAAAAYNENGEYVLKNKAAIENWGSSDATVTYKSPMLTKNGTTPKHNIENGQYEIDYTIDINPKGLKLGDSKTLELVDIGTNLSVDIRSIETTPKAGVSWNRDGDTLTFTIPNEQHVTITYTAYVHGNGEVHYSNTAKLRGQSVASSGDMTISSRGDSSNYWITIFKSEEGDQLTVLPGVKFNLYTAKETLGKDQKPSADDKDAWTLVNDEDKPFVTDENGYFIINASELEKHDPGHDISAGVHQSLYRNHWYMLEEIEDPVVNGVEYDGVGTKKLFWVDKDADADYTNDVYTNDDVVLISNKPKNTDKIGFTLKKVWEDAEAADLPEEISVQLYRKADIFTEKSDKDEKVGDPIVMKKSEYNGEMIWTAEITNLDKGYAYYIKEEAVPGFITEYDEYNDSGYTRNETITFTNKKQNVEVEKIWLDEDGNPMENPSDSNLTQITVKLKKDGKDYRDLILKKDNGWKVTLKDLDFPGEYTIEEPSLKGYELQGIVYQLSGDKKTSESLTAAGTVTITNRKKSITIKKRWLGAWGNDTGNPDLEYLKGLRVNVLKDGKLYGTYVLERSNNWELTVEDLEFPGTYTVEEADRIQGYTLTSILYIKPSENEWTAKDHSLSGSGQIILKNSKDSTTPDDTKTSITVQKEWLNATGEKLAEEKQKGLSAEVQLVRYRREKNGTKLHFMSGWEKTEFADAVYVKSGQTVDIKMYDDSKWETFKWQISSAKLYIDKELTKELDSSKYTVEVESRNITVKIDTGEYTELYFYYVYGQLSNTTVDEKYIQKQNIWEEDTTFNGSKLTLDEYNSFYGEFTDLKKEEEIDGKKYDYSYGVKELSASSPFKLKEYSTGIDEKSGASNPGESITITNQENEEDFVLPATGGAGSFKFVISGILLMIIALLMILKRNAFIGG